MLSATTIKCQRLQKQLSPDSCPCSGLQTKQRHLRCSAATIFASLPNCVWVDPGEWRREGAGEGGVRCRLLGPPNWPSSDAGTATETGTASATATGTTTRTGRCQGCALRVGSALLSSTNVTLVCHQMPVCLHGFCVLLTWTPLLRSRRGLSPHTPPPPMTACAAALFLHRAAIC